MIFHHFIDRFNLKWLIALLVISVAWVNFNHERWKAEDVITHDIKNYYSYLPAFFYENDLSLSFLDDSLNLEKERRYYTPNRTPEGRAVIKMSMGMAVSYLPFFALAHGYAVFFNYTPDGFSEPYHFAVLFSSLFYLVVGLIYLYKILLIWFSRKTTLLVLFCLCFGTNVFFYLTMAGAMSHAVGFALAAAFIFHTGRWHHRQSFTGAISLGMALGLLTLVRPVNGLLMIYFVFYDLSSYRDLIARMNLKVRHLLVIGFTALLVCLPQLLYWKHVSGGYFFNSYVGEHFYFNNPHVWEGLFSFRKGWLIYTPVMVLSLAGLFYLRSHLRRFLVPVLLLLIIYLYVVFSWWCWWYGGSFGQRVLIDIYPFLAIPFAAFISHFISVYGRLKPVLYAFLAFCTVLNLFQIMQARYNIIHFDSMTRSAYFRVLFTTSKQPDREHYLKHPDYKKALRGEDEN